MNIAIPLADGRLAQHFGHCEQFAIIDVDAQQKILRGVELVDSPPHQPGLLPGWLAEFGTDVVIAGGMGARAQELFIQRDIRVIIGAPSAAPEEVARDFLNGTLETGANLCDH
jgi:predicted Fe-Mo cluster-binding NifX family protein